MIKHIIESKGDSLEVYKFKKNVRRLSAMLLKVTLSA
jgi:hypothetical protein